MSPPIHSKHCETLQGFWLYRGTEKEPIGFIDGAPEHRDPQSLNFLTNTCHAKGEMRLLQDQGDGFCSYKLRTRDSEPLRFPAKEMISSKFPGLENYFGIPGTLVTKATDLPPTTALYDASSQLFYGLSHYYKNWFLIGPQDNFFLFQEGIKTFAQDLLDTWLTNPKEFFTPLSAEPLSSQGEEWDIGEAEGWIEIFLAWLENYDPSLSKQVKGKVAYASLAQRKTDGMDSNLFNAYYSDREEMIYLSPWFLDKMAEGNYLVVAEALKHEQTHREDFAMGVAWPSQQTCLRGVEIFLSQISEDNYSEPIISDFSMQHFQRLLIDKYCPYLFEEEAAAYMEQWQYRNQHSEESLLEENAFFEKWGALEQNFSPGVVELAGQYYELVQSTRQEL